MMQRIEHFSTGEIGAGHRLAYWNDVAAISSPGLSIDSADQGFRGELSRWRVGDLVLLHPRAGRSVVHRQAVRGEERLFAHLQTRGLCEQRQGAHEALLRAGDISVCTSSLPSQLRATEHEMLVVDLPRRQLEDRLSDLTSKLSRPIRSTSPAAHAFSQFLMSIWREGLQGAHPLDSEWERGVSGIVLDLLALTLRGADLGANIDKPGLARLKALVETRLEDPELSATTLAAELGLSVRTVQTHFATLGTTPRSYIQDRRLARAAERIRISPTESVTAIAYDLGFNDSAYFSRCFRRQFGMSPSEYRRGGGHGLIAH